MSRPKDHSREVAKGAKLGTSSITVQGDGAALTRTLGPDTPSTSGFAIGNPVRMYCLNAALYSLVHQ